MTDLAETGVNKRTCGTTRESTLHYLCDLCELRSFASNVPSLTGKRGREEREIETLAAQIFSACVQIVQIVGSQIAVAGGRGIGGFSGFH